MKDRPSRKTPYESEVADGEPAVQTAVQANVRRLSVVGGGSATSPDWVAAEAPLEVRIGGVPTTVLMRTPGYDEDLVRGFLYSEGVVSSAEDILSVGPSHASPEDVGGSVINVQLAPMRKGDYAAAAAALDGLLLDHPGDARAQLYLGIARLFQDEPQNALEFLRPLELNAPPDIGAEAAWYSLVGIARLRDPSGVENEARALCVSGKPTARRACAALEALGKDR